MATLNPNWIWSNDHKNYYYVTYDQWNRPEYHWAPQPDVRPRHDSSGPHDLMPNLVQVQPPEPVPNNVRNLNGFISGTPTTGWYDQLDASYRMRTGQEASRFFVEGRIFSMLYVENAAETAQFGRDADAYTVVRFGEFAHSTIRRFVVVEVRRGFVNACGIGTYSGRGTLKPGCVPSEHTIVYFTGTNPASCYIHGEYEGGMDKEPIQIEPADPNEKIRFDSRIRFSKTYPIEMNVKVKDIGRVAPGQLSTLLQYWSDSR
ncbi:hypothetical protein N0V83_001966 [Neocucurbitaria cava]|uniref:DUF6590 domain-containing protein n=1 Tax=Neocucurbitaria cava TaxID=798079 RepID=A0A9W9CQD1_9PLEO|nr:hypothetical protein N0V83_001966 [Neocucurbitaria cava]